MAVLAVFQGAALILALDGAAVLRHFMPGSKNPPPGGQATLSFDPAREAPPRKPGSNSIDQVRIPIRIEGLPPGTLVAAATIDYRIQSSGEFDYGETLHRLSADPVSGRWFDAVSKGDAWLRLNVERSYERQAPTQHFHARLRLVLLDVRTVETPLPEKPTRVMKDAWCYTLLGRILICYWPFQYPDYIQVLNPPPPKRSGPVTDYVTSRNSAVFFAPSPGGQSVWRETYTQLPFPPVPATVEARKVIARFERTLDIPSISIWKYTGPRAGFFEGLSQEP